MSNTRPHKDELASNKGRNLLTELEMLGERMQANSELQLRSSKAFRTGNFTYEPVKDDRTLNVKKGNNEHNKNNNTSDVSMVSGRSRQTTKIKYTPEQLRQISSENIRVPDLKLRDNDSFKPVFKEKRSMEHHSGKRWSFGSQSAKKWIPASEFKRNEKKSHHDKEEDEEIPEWADETDFTIDKDLSVYSAFNQTAFNSSPMHNREPQIKKNKKIAGTSSVSDVDNFFSSGGEQKSTNSTTSHTPSQNSKFSTLFTARKQAQKLVLGDAAPRFPPGLASSAVNSDSSALRINQPESDAYIASAREEMYPVVSSQQLAGNSSNIENSIKGQGNQQGAAIRTPDYAKVQRNQSQQSYIPMQMPRPNIPPGLNVAFQMPLQFQPQIQQQVPLRMSQQIPPKLPPPPPEMLELIRQGKLPPLAGYPMEPQQNQQNIHVEPPRSVQLPSPDRLPPELQAVYFDIQAKLLECQRRSIMPPPQLLQQMQQFQYVVQQHFTMTGNHS